MVDKYEIGTKHITNEGYEIEIVEKLKYPMRKVRFENGYEVVIQYGQINLGTIKNPYHPSVYVIGFIGIGEYKVSINRKVTPEYATWRSMLRRCYDEKFQEKNPTYKGVTVCEEWLNFQNFAKWYNENLPKIEGINFHLDKDLLQKNAENKIYSPDTCIFLPQSVNGFLTNKQSTNTSGYTGVSWSEQHKKWMAQISLFEGVKKRKTLGLFFTSELASKAYQSARAIESEKVKSYLRSLNYLPEEIIQLVK